MLVNKRQGTFLCMVGPPPCLEESGIECSGDSLIQILAEGFLLRTLGF